MSAARRSATVIAIALLRVLATSEPAHAQPAAASSSASTRDDGALEIRLDALGGVAAAPFITMDLPQTEGNGAALVLAGRMRLRPMLDIGVRVPLALVDVTQPAGSYVAEAAWGNPELFVEHAHAVALSRPLFVRARLAVGAPLAEHGSSGLMENRALAIADALLAWRERELFVPGVVPITPAGELSLPWQRWSLHAIVKLPVLVRVSDASPAGTTSALGLTPVVGLRARADITSRLAVTGGAVAVFELVRPLDWVDRSSRIQTSVQADLAWRIAGPFHIGATVLVPVGGALGGETFAAGISLAHMP